MKFYGLKTRAKNKRLRLSIGEDGSVYIETKRLRETADEPLIMTSTIGYKRETFHAILQLYTKLRYALDHDQKIPDSTPDIKFIEELKCQK